MAPAWHIRPIEPGDASEWLRMRQALWPGFKEESLRAEMVEIAADDRQQVYILARQQEGTGGFIEVALRPWADGCETHPVGYIEAWYVDSDLRRQGAGAALVNQAEDWARTQGCTEMASDCELWNDVSFHAHLALGYREVTRTINFRKDI